jgi:hypothetical protein
MGVYESRGQLAKGMKDLLTKWIETKMSWNDSVSERFEKTFLEPLEKDLRNAGSAMDQAANLLNKIRRECE